ncbi:MAG TPA: hypothetical protein GXX38_05805 [Clostridia bacterium]|nr:hypothetical protein [Clostridia bacterium]
MGLQIETRPLLLGIKTQKPVQSLEQPRGEQDIRQVKAEMIIDREWPRVIIDQYECFAEAGLKGNLDLAREYAELGKRVVLEYTGRIAQEGDRFGRIEDGLPARAIVAEIAERNAWPEYDFNVDCIPKSRPKIEVVGHLNIDWRLGGAEIDYRPRKTIHYYQPGKANIYVRQWNSINIRHIDERA